MQQQGNTPGNQAGISIILLAGENLDPLSRFLDSFFTQNSYFPIEFIVIDNIGTSSLNKLVGNYINKAFFKIIKSNADHNKAVLLNYAADAAAYPYLLFVREEIIITSDILYQMYDKLNDPFIGAVGVSIKKEMDDVNGVSPVVSSAGVLFYYNEGIQQLIPDSVYFSLECKTSLFQSGLYPAVTDHFLLCRKNDFKKAGGFDEEYCNDFMGVDLCLLFWLKLGKKSYSINDSALKLKTIHKEADLYGTVLPAVLKHDIKHFNDRMSNVVNSLLEARPELAKNEQWLNQLARNICVLFVLPSPIDSDQGYHVQGLARVLKDQEVEVVVAVPEKAEAKESSEYKNFTLLTYADILQNGINGSNKTGPDIIHAWTPRETVREFIYQLKVNYSCPVIIHLEDNEDFIVEKTTGISSEALSTMSEQAIDSILPRSCYHPVRGKAWLKEACGITMAIDSLEKFNYGKVESITLLPPTDEAIFYPREINYQLRRKLDISDDHLTIVYSGTVHKANLEDVLNLYKAVRLLSEKGCPATIIRTGKNSILLDETGEQWIRNIEKPLGWVDRNSIADIMSAADIFIQPGNPDSFNNYRLPCNLPEYFALGRPVVVPKIRAVQDITHLEEAYLLSEKAGEEEICCALETIWSNKELADRLSQGAVEYYLKNFSDPVTGQKLKHFYMHYMNLAKGSILPEETLERFSADGAFNEKASVNKSFRQNKAIASDAHFNYPEDLPPLEYNKWTVIAQQIEAELDDRISIVSSLEAAIINNRLPKRKQWAGIVHTLPFKMPAWAATINPYKMLNANSFLSSKDWKESQKDCCCLISFSDEQAEQLKTVLGLPVLKVRRNLPHVEEKFTMKKYNNNKKKKVVQVGWWLQRMHGIYCLPVQDYGLIKVWLKYEDSNINNILEKEEEHLRSRNIYFDYMHNTVEIISNPTEKEYKNLLCENIVFAHYYDGAMLDFLHECLARQVPILINPHKAVREYLGDDYPFYYYFYKDAAEKAVNKELIQETHNYLRKLSNQFNPENDILVQDITDLIKERIN